MGTISFTSLLSSQFLIFVSPYHTHDHPRVALSLDALHLPQLQSLVLKGPGYPFPDAATGLFSADEMTRVRDLLNRSACSLKCLVIDSPIPVREYLSILVGPGKPIDGLESFREYSHRTIGFQGVDFR